MRQPIDIDKDIAHATRDPSRKLRMKNESRGNVGRARARASCSGVYTDAITVVDPFITRVDRKGEERAGRRGWIFLPSQEEHRAANFLPFALAVRDEKVARRKVETLIRARDTSEPIITKMLHDRGPPRSRVGGRVEGFIGRPESSPLSRVETAK